MHNFKAIETMYSSYRMRSRLEARWAVFFDFLDIPWEYEKEGYEINGVRYLPDFWLPEQEIFVEIKGQIMPAESEFQKCSDLSTASKHPVYMFAGPIPLIQEDAPPDKLEIEYNGYHFLNGVLRINYIWTQCFLCAKIGVSPLRKTFALSDFERLYCSCHKQYIDAPLFDLDVSDKYGLQSYIAFSLKGAPRFLVKAYTAARSARFEFGEKGK